MDVNAKLDAEVHEAFTDLAKIKGVGIGELTEQLIKAFIAADFHDFNLRMRSNVYRRLSENFQETGGKLP